MHESIPAFQKAMVFEEHNGPLKIKTIPVPKPSSNEILVKIQYSGVCHSDLHAWKGDWPSTTKLPLVGGHEGTGIVVAMGESVTGWEIGDYAGIKWLNSSCLSCEYCCTGNEINCNRTTISGFTMDGTFQEYARADALHAAKLPRGVDLAALAPVLCAGITVYRALKTAGLSAGQWVAISGAGGGLGSYAVQYAKAMGYRVLAIDGGLEKGTFVKDLGAEVYVDFKESENIVKEIREWTKGGPHGVINVAVSESAVSQACQYVRSCGTVVLVGIPPNAKIITPIFDAVVRSISIKGTSVGSRAETSQAIDFFVRGLIKSPIVITSLLLLPEIYEKMEKGQILGRYVVDISKDF